MAPRSPGGISLKRSPQASVITVPPAIATRKIRREVPERATRAEAAGEEPDAVYRRGASVITRARPMRSPIGPATSAATM